MPEARVSRSSRKNRSPKNSSPQASPPRTIDQLRAEISHLDCAIAALERYAKLTADPAPARKPKRATVKAAAAGQT